MSPTVPRVVLDTNLVLSALIFQNGRLTPLRVFWQKGVIIPLVCQATVAELIRALGYPKFRLTAAEQDELLADYLPYCNTVQLPDPLLDIPKCRDPADESFLQLALAGKADALVTGDKDLLVLAKAFVCPILTAEVFLAGRHGVGWPAGGGV